MKNKGKKMSLLGTILVLLVYVVLQWTGIINPKEASTQESAKYQESTQESESVEVPRNTEVPESTESVVESTQPETSEQLVEASQSQESSEASFNDEPPSNYEFRNQRLEDNHYEKHGIEMGFASVEDYIAAANQVIDNPDSLYKLEAEDNDHIYFLEETNEFVVLSQDGYIRTYYIADGGIDYFNRQ